MTGLRLVEYFGSVATTREHNGYIHSVGRTLAIAILGSLCGLRSVVEIHQWANSPRVKTFLKEQLAIFSIPTYAWLEKILTIICPKALNEYFILWTTTFLPEVIKDLTISFDGKTICSTGKMNEYDKPLHI